MTAPARAEVNTRPCGACRHMDARIKNGVAYCWRFYFWVRPQETIRSCGGAERPDGDPPPGQIWFTEQG